MSVAKAEKESVVAAIAARSRLGFMPGNLRSAGDSFVTTRLPARGVTWPQNITPPRHERPHRRAHDRSTPRPGFSDARVRRDREAAPLRYGASLSRRRAGDGDRQAKP